MTITTNTTKDYFEVFIAVQSALMPDKRFKLTPKEQEFLAECAAYNSKGGNLHDFEELCGFLIGKGIVASPQECSVYKNRLSIKKWIETGRGKFRLPPMLTSAKGYDFHLRLNDNGSRSNGRKVSVPNERGAGVSSDG